MIITSRQKKEKIILSYIKNPRLNGRKRFFSHKRKALEMVDAETDRRIGEALENIKQGKYVKLSSPKEIEDYFNSLLQA